MRRLQPSSQTWFSLLLLLAGLVWIWISRTPEGGTTQGRIPAPQIGFLAPDFSLLMEDGQSITLSALRGRPVVVNLWASWCQPCRAEMPTLQKVYQEYQSRDLILIGVNTAYQDEHDKALAFVQENNLTFPILFDNDGRVSRLYSLRALPTTFFIDADGIIQDIVIGGPMETAKLRVRVEQLINKSMKSEGEP